MRLEGYIKEHYPEWWGIREYPAEKTAAFCGVAEPWGILGNFAPTPLVVDGVPFDCTEKLFQVMKFTDAESRKGIYSLRGQKIKMRAKHCAKLGDDGTTWSGPNIMGRLLMELRDRGTLSYTLPEDAVRFQDLKEQ